jgi:uncharacterized cupin superfamily protein
LSSNLEGRNDMANVTIKVVDDCDTAHGGAMKLVRHGLGVEAFGMQVIDLPPNVDAYPEHDHSGDGQEEVYTVLQGAAVLITGDEENELTPNTFARVPAGQSRKLVTRDQPARILAVGGVPGKVYEAPEMSRPQAAVA